MKFDKFEEQVFFNTVLIQNKTDQEFGTGFLLAKEIGNNRVKILLYSNKHVFWGKKDQNNQTVKKQIEIKLHGMNTDDSYSLGNVKKFNFSLVRNINNNYHECKDLDVAAIDISSFYNIPDFKSGMRALKYEDFCDYNYSEIPCGQEVVFLGYPTGFYDQKNFLPIMRKGSISSIPRVDFNGRKEILIDAGVYPGSSGSPVFISLQGKYKLLGIISQAVYQGLNFIPGIISAGQEKPEQKIPVEWIGIGILIKNDAIKEIYDLF